MTIKSSCFLLFFMTVFLNFDPESALHLGLCLTILVTTMGHKNFFVEVMT